MMLPAGSGAIPASLWGPREWPKVFCPQISLQSVYLMTPSNGVVEGEGAQIRLWPSGRPRFLEADFLPGITSEYAGSDGRECDQIPRSLRTIVLR